VITEKGKSGAVAAGFALERTFFQFLKSPWPGNWELGPPPDVNGELAVTLHEGVPLMECDRHFTIWVRWRPPFPIWKLQFLKSLKQELRLQGHRRGGVLL